MTATFAMEYCAEFVVDPPGLPPDFTFSAADAKSSRFQRVRVETSGGYTWTADFALERDAPSRALNGLLGTPDAATVLAVVGGAAYLVPVNDPSRSSALLLDAYVIEYLRAVDKGLILLATDWFVTAVSDSGICWQTDRLAIEGLHLGGVAESRLWVIADPDTAKRDIILDLSTGRNVSLSGQHFPPSL